MALTRGPHWPLQPSAERAPSSQQIVIHLKALTRPEAEAECARIANKGFTFLRIERRDVIKRVPDASRPGYKLVKTGECELVGVFMM